MINSSKLALAIKCKADPGVSSSLLYDSSACVLQLLQGTQECKHGSGLSNLLNVSHLPAGALGGQGMKLELHAR